MYLGCIPVYGMSWGSNIIFSNQLFWDHLKIRLQWLSEALQVISEKYVQKSQG